MLPNKGFNMPMPKSQVNSGRDLDDGCGKIEQAEASGLMDAHKSQFQKLRQRKLSMGGNHEGYSVRNHI